MPHSSLSIANEFLTRAFEGGDGDLTQMQVQKLVYLAHGWHLGAMDVPLIEDQVEAWKFGPVIRKLYSALSQYGSGPITRLLHWGDDTVLLDSDDDGVAREDLSSSQHDIIELVWESYGRFPAFKLSALTHKRGTPWSSTYQEGSKRVINNELIQEHFKTLIAQVAESKIPPDLERRIREAVGRSKKSINAKTKPDSKDRDEDSTVREAKAKARALEESNEDSVSFRALREKYARWVFIYLVIYSAVCGVLLVLHGLKCIEFGLPDTVLEYLVGSTAVSAIGLVLAVTHGLFKK